MNKNFSCRLVLSPPFAWPVRFLTAVCQARDTRLAFEFEVNYERSGANQQKRFTGFF
jgi:hypothetical protein